LLLPLPSAGAVSGRSPPPATHITPYDRVARCSLHSRRTSPTADSSFSASRSSRRTVRSTVDSPRTAVIVALMIWFVGTQFFKRAHNRLAWVFSQARRSEGLSGCRYPSSVDSQRRRGKYKSLLSRHLAPPSFRLDPLPVLSLGSDDPCTSPRNNHASRRLSPSAIEPALHTVVARICGRTQALHSASNSFARIPQKPTSQTKPISLPIPTKKTIYFSRPEPVSRPPG
jgi:hypothetical protein